MFEPGGHFISRLSMIVRVNVVLNRTVVVDRVTHVSTTCAVFIFRVKVSCITSFDGIKLIIDLIGQPIRSITGV